MTLKDLTELKYQADRKKFPTVPAYAVHKTVYTDSTANGLTKAIITFCELNNVLAMRTGSEGRYRAGAQVVDVIGRTRVMKGHYLPGQNVGQGDIQIILKGLAISVEVKIGKDRQSDDQKEFESKFTSSGGIYVIVKSWEEFYSYWKTWTTK